MLRRVWIGVAVVGVATACGGVARASGNELGGLDLIVDVIVAVFALVPLAISWFLLFGKPTTRVWVWGTLMGGIAVVVVDASELEPRAAFLGVALLPVLAHLFKRLREKRRARRDGNAGDGDGKPGAG